MRKPQMQFAAKRLLIAVALVLAAPPPSNAKEPYFPESAFFPKDKELNAFAVEHFTAQLQAMEEPSLWTLSQNDRVATVYRFLWLATNELPICVRLSRTGEAFSLHVAQHDGSPGRTTGRLILNKDVKLSVKQGERLIGLLQKTPFWTSPVEVKESRGIADGDVIVIEGVKGGRYHIVDREGSTTRESYKKFCRFMIELADPDVLKGWDHHRKGERESPDYRPDPPETEDLGGPDPPDKGDQADPTEP